MVSKHLEVVLALWAGAKVLLENEISISIKLVSRWKHKVLQNLLVEGCIDFGLDKTQWTNTSRWHGSPNHHFTLDFKQHGFCDSPLFLQTPDLDFQMNGKMYFNLKRGLWTTEQQSSSLGKMLLTMFLFQKWLGSSFPEDVWARWLLIHWLQLQFTPCEALPSVWIGFAWQYSQACGHPCWWSVISLCSK